MDSVVNFKKNGLIFLVFPMYVIIFIIILIGIVFIFFQINISLLAIKTDIFYILNNAIIAIDKEEMAYGSFEVDEEKLKFKIQEIIQKNYKVNNMLIKSITVEDLYFNYDKEEPKVNIKVNIKLIPIMNINKNYKEYSIVFEDEIKIKLLDYGE